MSDDQNKREIEWLNQQPTRLLEHYQYIVEATVARFISRGFFEAGEKMEVVQSVNLELLEKRLARIREHFDGRVFLRTYFSKVVYNCCLELIRRQQRQPQLLDAGLLYDKPAANRTAYEQLAIQDELGRLEALLRGHRQRYKLLLCLKLWVRSPLQPSDWQFFAGPRTEAAIAALARRPELEGLSDGDAFELGAALFSRLEEKTIQGDSLRRWVNEQAQQLITALNGDPPIAQYSRETLRILLRYYFAGDKS